MITAPDQEDPEQTPPPKAARQRSRRWRWAALGLLVLAAVLAVLAVSVRLGVRTGPGRAYVARLLEGMEIGPFGRLHIEGLGGDLLHDFTVRRLEIIDAKGPWLDARDVAMRWDYGELFARRFHAERIAAGQILVLRRPLVRARPPRAQQNLPVSIKIDQVQARLETLPAFSFRHGLWDLAAQLEVHRDLAARGQVSARSQLHAGDGLQAVFQYGDHNRLVLRADAVEASGGALAGALGLAPDQPLHVHGEGDGTADAGRLTFVTHSGAETPLAANALWGKAGTRINARVVLADSKLTARFVDRVGPELDLALAANHLQGDTYKIDAGLTGRQLSAAAHGPVDWKTRNTPGVNLKLWFADLSKWVDFPKIGAVRASGTFAGDLGKFRYQAAVDGQRLDEWGYTLARASGPAVVTREKGEWRMQASFAGAGGAGQGLIPALMGRAPKVVVDGSRLADGRIFLRKVDVTGAGLKVLATGGQGLFGGLSFKGDAAVSNLAAAHPGAHGLVKASWSASEPKGSRLWDFTFDAQASSFGSGWPEADRLLGPAPRLVAKANLGPAGWGVMRADLTGTAGQAAFNGLITRELVMALNMTWSAKGPFHAGPLEIAGGIHGDGKLSGKITEPRADLNAQLASLDLGRLVVAPARIGLTVAVTPTGSDGQISVAGSSTYGRATAKAGFRFVPGGVDLSNILADAGGVKAAGALSLRSGAPSTADLTVAAGPGAFLTHGEINGTLKLAGRPGGAVASLALSGQGIAAPELPVPLRTVQLKANGPLSRLPFQVSADGGEPFEWRFAGNGTFAQQAGENQIDLTGVGRLRGADVRTLEPAILRFGANDRSAVVHASIGGGRADLNARQLGDALQARANLQGVSLAAFSQDFVGKVNGALALDGRGARLGGNLDATLEGARTRDAPARMALNGRIKAILRDARVHLDASATNSEGLQSQASADLPAEAAAQPFRIAINRTQPIRGTFSAEGELRPLWDILTGGTRMLSGKVATSGTLGGSINNPDITGHASLSGGRFEDSPTGLVLQNLNVQADFGQNAVNVRQFAGADPRGGTISGDGRLSLAKGGNSTFSLDLHRFRLIDNEIARATTSGQVTVTRDVQGQVKLVGALTVDRADIVAQTPVPSGVVPMDVVEVYRKKGAGEITQPQKPGGPQVALDVSIRAPRGIYVRGRGLNVELSLNAHVGGTTANPDLTGLASVYLGAYEFAGKRFDFDTTGTVTLASRPELIRLNLSATLDDPTLTAVVRVQGTAARPEITLSSRPVLPQDEVLARVLFGTSASQLSPVQAAQLASALAGLAGGGGFDVLGNLRQFAGLDRLAFGTGPTGTGTTVSGGKYINNHIYVELTGGGRTGPSAQVEFRLRRNLSVISQVGAQGDARLSVRFRQSYGSTH